MIENERHCHRPPEKWSLGRARSEESSSQVVVSVCLQQNSLATIVSMAVRYYSLPLLVELSHAAQVYGAVSRPRNLGAK